MDIAPPKKHARLASAKPAKRLFEIKIRDTQRLSPPKPAKRLFEIKIRNTERQSPPLAPKLSPPKRSPPKRSPPKRSPPKRSPPKRSPPKLSPPKRSPPKRSPPKTHLRQRKVFEITDTLTKEQIKEQKIKQKIEKIEQLNAKFIEYIRNRNAGTLPPFKRGKVSAFDQLDNWIKEYDKEHQTKRANKIAK